MDQNSAPMMYAGVLPSFDDLPPAGLVPTDAEPVAAPPPMPPPQDPPAPPVRVTRTPVRIVRARTGAKELRLLSERENGKHKRYVLERVHISPPYSSEMLPLMKNHGKSNQALRGADQPMSKDQANRAFDRAVAATFRGVRLNGAVIPTSTVVLDQNQTQ